jgi:hypothetical protein
MPRQGRVCPPPEFRSSSVRSDARNLEGAANFRCAGWLQVPVRSRARSSSRRKFDAPFARNCRTDPAGPLARGFCSRIRARLVPASRGSAPRWNGRWPSAVRLAGSSRRPESRPAQVQRRSRRQASEPQFDLGVARCLQAHANGAQRASSEKGITGWTLSRRREPPRAGPIPSS